MTSDDYDDIAYRMKAAIDASCAQHGVVKASDSVFLITDPQVADIVKRRLRKMGVVFGIDVYSPEPSGTLTPARSGPGR